MQHAHILIVEDDPIARTMLAGWVGSFGSVVSAVECVEAADRVLAEANIDLIISDVHLPGNHQLEWVEQVLARDTPPPVILLTGNPELSSTLRAANLPIGGYLVKPPDFKALGALTQRLILDHRRRREFRALSREAAWLLTHPESSASRGNDPLREKLLSLSRHLAAEAHRNPRAAVPAATEPGWRPAITETIAVLEKTRHSFRSKELGQLRQRLQRFLDQGAAA